MGRYNREKVGKKTLVKIHQKNRFDIIDHPCEWKYYLSANLKTESTVKILSDAIKEIVVNAIDYIHLDNISVLPGFELIDESFVPTIELVCEEGKLDMAYSNIIYSLVLSFLCHVTTVINPRDYIHESTVCCDNELKQYIENTVEEFLIKRRSKSIGQVVTICVNDKEIDIGGSWKTREQVVVEDRYKKIVGQIDSMLKISSTEFTVQDMHKKKYKISYTADQFDEVYYIFGQKNLYSFSVLEKTFDSEEKKSYSLCATTIYDENEFSLTS